MFEDFPRLFARTGAEPPVPQPHSAADSPRRPGADTPTRPAGAPPHPVAAPLAPVRPAPAAEARPPIFRPAELPTHAPVIGNRIVAQPYPALSGQPLALPTLRADAGVLGGRWVAAASIAGLTHQADATTAQDSYCAGYSVDGSALVLAVCDGLGYREHTSQVGADLLARLCCAYAAWIVREQALAEGTEALIRAVEQANLRLVEMQRMHLPEWEPADLHCTVMVCRVPLTPDGGPTLFARAGDTEAFLLRDAQYATVFAPDTEAGPTNVVKGPLPQQNPREVLQVTAVDLDADALILTTDGLAHDIFDSPGTREWLSARWAVPCGPHRMLDSLRYRRQSSHDDRTALVVWLRPWTGDGVDDAADHR